MLILLLGLGGLAYAADSSQALTSTPLTELGKSVKAIEVIVHGKKPSQLTDQDLRELAVYRALEAMEHLNKLKAAELDATVTSGNKTGLSALLSSEDSSLRALQRAAGDYDREGVLKIGLSLSRKHRKLVKALSPSNP
jgi:hypothetical protein